MKNKSVPPTLRTWFVIHFAVDMLVAVPLFFIPEIFLGLLGWQIIDPITSRLVAAAFFGIGIQSFMNRNEHPAAFKAMLNLKIIWSGFAVLGFGWSIYEGGPISIWLLLVTFLFFNFLWIYWRVQLGKIFTE